jgi:hypothetical protein
VLRHYLDLDEAATAAALGCSIGTVKSQTAKGLARLRATLDAEPPPLAKRASAPADLSPNLTRTRRPR